MLGSSISPGAVVEVIGGLALPAGAGKEGVFMVKALVVVGKIPMPRPGSQKLRPLHTVDGSGGPASSSISLNQGLKSYCCLMGGFEDFDLGHVVVVPGGDGGIFGEEFGLLDLLVDC